MKLRLCTECNVGAFTEEQVLKHEEETGHKMDDGHEVEPINHKKEGDE